ncbi:hypothetical protein NITHO_6740001 [Nitrolancea hollandica Lb]|uniref:Uncharacterized protein n=1 Tax=Nitrolancea hollandica Lb TaxID=1129897 RepID=I4EMX3_9BACT|nr:hypothetical protein NITHO_6740001 [Nitrolancea hollandica Lb]
MNVYFSFLYFTKDYEYLLSR